MRSRGDVKRLWVGVLIALPSGAGVALSVLGGNTGKKISINISKHIFFSLRNRFTGWCCYFRCVSIDYKLF